MPKSMHMCAREMTAALQTHLYEAGAVTDSGPVTRHKVPGAERLAAFTKVDGTNPENLGEAQLRYHLLFPVPPRP